MLKTEQTVKDRILEFISLKGISVNKFEITSGLSVGYLRQLRREPSLKKLEGILAAFPEINRDWLLTGEGEMLCSTDVSNARLVGPYIVPIYGDSGVYRIPALPIGAQATFAESFTDGVHSASNGEFFDIPLAPEESKIESYLLTIQVDGESMEPTLADGAWILSKRIKDSQWGNVGGVVFVSFGDFFVVKRIKVNRLFTENYIVLSSDNPDYGEMTVQLSDIHAMWKALRIVSSPIL